MKKLYPFALLLFIFLNSNAQSPVIDKLQRQIENSVRPRPDSAKIYLFRLLHHASELHDTVLAETYSNLGVQYNKLGVPDSAEYFMKKAFVYSEKYPLAHARMYMNLAINYRIGSRYKESLAVLDTAIALYKKAGSRMGEGIALGEMASNYNYMMDSGTAMEYLKKAIAILTQSGDVRELSVVKQKLANVYYNNGDYTFARDLFEEVLPIFEKEKSTNYYYTLLGYADCLLQLEENYPRAEEALKEVENALRAMNNQEVMFLSSVKLAQVYAATSRPQLAEHTFQEAYDGLYQLNSHRFMEVSAQYLDFLNTQSKYDTALEVIARVKSNSSTALLKMNADNEISFLKHAVTTYGQKGMVEHSLKAFERMDFLKDSLNVALNNAKAMELRESYQNELQREKNMVLTRNNDLLRENNNKKDKILLLSILLFALLLLIGILAFVGNRNKLKLQRQMVTNLENSKKVLEEKNRLEGQLLGERERSLIYKDKELVTVSLEMSDLQNRITELIETRENPEQSLVFARKLQELLGKKNYWKYFKGKFVEVHPVFASSLAAMFPNLSDSEIAFCCMLKLQLSSIEIGSLMGLSIAQVESKKANICRKVGMENDITAFENLMENLG